MTRIMREFDDLVSRVQVRCEEARVKIAVFYERGGWSMHQGF